MKFCTNCGKELDSNAMFCDDCGTPCENLNMTEEASTEIANENQETAGNAFDQEKSMESTLPPNNKLRTLSILKQKPVKNVAIIIAAIVVIVIIAIIISSNSGTNFKKIYKEYCSSTWAEVGSDGSYLSVDTNPFDVEDAGAAYEDAYYAISSINEELGLPDSLFEEMGSTTANDGKQVETFGDITVTYKYHPDDGLEVIYKKNK